MLEVFKSWLRHLWEISFPKPTVEPLPTAPAESSQTETEPQRMERIGRQNEARALRLSRKLFKSDQLPMATGLPFRSEPGSNADLEALDILIPTNIGLVGIQIKSSNMRHDEFVRTHKMGKIIPAIVVNPMKTDDRVLLDLESAFAAAYRIKGEHIAKQAEPVSH